MLQLQRASAGSGKTYTLAKKFIWFLIAIKCGRKKWRLRTPAEIADGLPRILAITFTNKATNEMKQRIVEKLADLAKADGSMKLSTQETDAIAYLNEFAKELSTDTTTVGKTCREALSVLLNEYSDFKVSTIDSFFQTILRTFAYESNLNDTYQVEIDSDYIATAAIDSTLDDINNLKGESRASFWINELIKEEADAGKTSWNIFQKSGHRDSLYSRLRRYVMKLENEDFKEIRSKLDDYFDNTDGHDPLIKAYIANRDSIQEPLRNFLSTAKKEARRLTSLFRKAGLNIAADGHRYLKGHIEKLGKLRFNQTVKTNIFSPLSPGGKDSILKKGISCGNVEELTATATRMYEAYASWKELREKPQWKHWALYAPQIPYLGLIGEARRKMREFLENNNTIQLGETNSMLRRIIGKDDTTFIYERLGSSINHYLIDEFQDTSSMQWENLYPLLWESDSRGEDNLIIGDAKQSIYRFRNADPSLITGKVPDAFPRHIEAGMSKTDNTNWRSDRTVVEFNNFFFHFLVNDILDDASQGTIDFINLYSNVAQYASHRERKGYVEINFLTPDAAPSGDYPAMEDSGNDRLSKEEIMKANAMKHIGPLVSDLLKRGYRQRDIAFLVDTNDLGKEVITALVEYNAAMSPEERRIEFISEESLLVSSAESVGIIINVLEKMTSRSDIRSGYSFYSLQHPEMTAAEQIKGFMEENSPSDAINDMLGEMQTVALPALVEAITEKFVPRDMRRSQAVFISALQDMVLEYTDRYAADISSFLSWWKSKGVTRSISSPEGTDAVQIMTVHKSKGLEFKCVILPFSDASFIPTQKKTEWKWVKPAGCLSDSGLPPYLPVETTSALKDTEHEKVWTQFHDLHMMDKLNSTYVAFTRAVDELYIFTARPEKENSMKLGGLLYSICGNADVRIAGESSDISELLLPPGMVEWNNLAGKMTFGTPPAVRINTDKKRNGMCRQRVVEEYGVDSSPSVLKYVEGDDNGGSTLPEASDTDPRSEGNLLHAIMERVKVASDLPNAVTSLRMNGMITSAQAKNWQEMLEKAISGQLACGWFHPSWKVMTERSVLSHHGKDPRPDRIMISPDRQSAVIVDYKFGAIPTDNSHIRQVRGYMTAFKEATGIYNVSGFVWYVRIGKIIPA